MALKKIEQVKKDSGFKLFDIIIYGAVLVLVAVLFIVLFTTRDKSTLTGIRIYVHSQVVFEYEFGGEPQYTDSVEVREDGNGIYVTILNGNDKNVVFIDNNRKTVKMTEANCKGKECLYFAAMDNNSDFIYCSPHGVKVEPLKQDLDNPNIKI
ncbi:MAG: NusG domain II-containing protein [Clostridia bacterium]|nr:NusG domain II-containing protein [Clostridia bacterium]